MINKAYTRGYITKLAQLTNRDILKRVLMYGVPTAAVGYGVSRLGSRLLGGRADTPEEVKRRKRLAQLIAVATGAAGAFGALKSVKKPVTATTIAKDNESQFRNYLTGPYASKLKEQGIDPGPIFKQLRKDMWTDRNPTELARRMAYGAIAKDMASTNRPEVIENIGPHLREIRRIFDKQYTEANPLAPAIPGNTALTR